MAKRNLWKTVTMAIAGMIVISTYTRYVAYQAIDSPQNHEVGNPSNLTSKGEEMKLRIQRMRETCSQYPVRRQLQAKKLGGKKLFYISEKHKLSYCRVAKVGSTFWTQVFMTLAGVQSELDENGDIKSMFDIPRDEAHEKMKKMTDLVMQFHDPRVHETTSFLVARNPYSRLFSSYIDQIFLPNKWQYAAQMVEDPKRRKCGNDVTFDEFLSTISEWMLTGLSMDLHWAPIFSICSPCESNFDILAKQETFNEDADYILDVAGVSQSVRDEVANVVGKSLLETSLPTLVHTYVTKGQYIKKGCISNSNLAMKIWSAFQIQGYIHNDTPFPAEQFEFVTSSNLEEELTKAVLDAIKQRKLSSSERAQQRQEWKLKYWKNVTLKTLRKVQDAYYEDFFAFQYDLDPNTM